MKHKLTSRQARVLNRPDLAGELVDVELCTKKEKPPEFADFRITKSVRFNGQEIGETISLDE